MNSQTGDYMPQEGYYIQIFVNEIKCSSKGIGFYLN